MPDDTKLSFLERAALFISPTLVLMTFLNMIASIDAEAWIMLVIHTGIFLLSILYARKLWSKLK